MGGDRLSELAERLARDSFSRSPLGLAGMAYDDLGPRAQAELTAAWVEILELAGLMTLADCEMADA